jgi:hypothetical protein
MTLGALTREMLLHFTYIHDGSFYFQPLGSDPRFLISSIVMKSAHLLLLGLIYTISLALVLGIGSKWVRAVVLGIAVTTSIPLGVWIADLVDSVRPTIGSVTLPPSSLIQGLWFTVICAVPAFLWLAAWSYGGHFVERAFLAYLRRGT